MPSDHVSTASAERHTARRAALRTAPRPGRGRSASIARVALTMLATVLAALLASGQPASAHNELVSTDPADGAVLQQAPASVSFVFAAEVPLESATVTVIDPSGVRTDVVGLTHGSTTNIVVAPMPTLPPGEVTVRWRLVSDDGHPITGRVVYTVSAPATSAPAAATTVPAAGTPAVTTVPALPEVATSDAAAADGAASAADEGSGSTPEPVRWLLRYGSYVAIMLVIAVVATDRWVWPGVARRYAGVIEGSLLAVAVLAALQLLVLASDFRGSAPWAAFGDIDRALLTDAGQALALRVLLAAVVWLVLMRMTIATEHVRWSAIGIAGVVLMGTWAWAGHSKSQRWPEIGVPLDIVHHSAAAFWIGALAIVGIVAMRDLDGGDRTQVLGRLSSTAGVAVAMIVVTGALQGLRLVESPTRLLDSAHGRYLAAKVAVIVVMLGLAYLNRRRLSAPTSRPGGPSDAGVAALRRSVLGELTLGLVVIAITASLVVASPQAADSGTTSVSAGTTAPRD